MIGLGLQYIIGIGKTQNIKKGIDLIIKEDSEEAWSILGKLYSEGIFVEKDMDIAL